jgi:PAS domain S-box-containing protein
VLVNRETEKLFGYDREEILGEPVQTLVPERIRNARGGERRVESELRHARRIGTSGGLFGLRKNGSEFPVEIGLNPIETEEGVFVLVAVVDIGERQHLEHEQRLLSSLVENVEDYAIITLDLDGRITTWNAGAERIKGYPAEDIVGRHFSVFYVPEDVASGRPEAELATARAAGRHAQEGWRVRADGSRFWALVTVATMRDASGALIGYSKITRDLTEQRLAEQRFRATIESAPTAMVMIDDSGRIALLNAETEKLFGYGRDELLNEPVEVLLPERFRAGHPQLRDAYFGHYVRVLYLAQTEDETLTARAMAAAERLGLAFARRVTGFGGLDRFLARAAVQGG